MEYLRKCGFSDQLDISSTLKFCDSRNISIGSIRINDVPGRPSNVKLVINESEGKVCAFF